ncbi:hypothetical protein ACRAWF_05655 [Streptomyces sp. L7]
MLSRAKAPTCKTRSSTSPCQHDGRRPRAAPPASRHRVDGGLLRHRLRGHLMLPAGLLRPAPYGDRFGRRRMLVVDWGSSSPAPWPASWRTMRTGSSPPAR